MQWFFMYLFVCGVYLRIDEYLGIFPSIHFLRGQVVKPRWRYPTQISFISRSNMFRVDSSVVFFCCFLPSPSLSKFQQPAFHNFQGVDPKVNIRQFKGGGSPIHLDTGFTYIQVATDLFGDLTWLVSPLPSCSSGGELMTSGCSKWLTSRRQTTFWLSKISGWT